MAVAWAPLVPSERLTAAPFFQYLATKTESFGTEPATNTSPPATKIEAAAFPAAPGKSGYTTLIRVNRANSFKPDWSH